MDESGVKHDLSVDSEQRLGERASGLGTAGGRDDGRAGGELGRERGLRGDGTEIGLAGLLEEDDAGPRRLRRTAQKRQ